MYQKYHTEALVLGSRERGESDKVFALYTQDFGLVHARASAVRKENSKMRYALQDFSRVSVSLVRGKRGWRAAGAMAGTPLRSAAFARICELMLRLVRGQERNEYLFAALADAHAAFADAKQEDAIVEIVCVARVLYALGYISPEALDMGHASFSGENVRDPASRRRAPALRRGPTPVSLFTHTAYSGESLMEAESMKDKLLLSINRALTETHL